MGKATRWLRSLFGAKKSSPVSIRSGCGGKQKTHGSSATGIPSGSPYRESSDANKHAIAVAAATAAVAEAALATAHAAAEVVRLTVGGSRTHHGGARRREVAAVKIQSAFRAYLARRALRALKGLVKLQALVRGHIVRKHSADMLRRMQAMARVQARVSTNRAFDRHHHPASKNLSTTFTTRDHSKCNSMSNAKGSSGQQRQRLNWLEIWMEETSRNSKYRRPDDEKRDKVLEADTWKPRLREILPLGSMIIQEAEKAAWTAENTPRVYSASSSRPASSHKRSPFTPNRAEYSQSLFGDYPTHPNYMANTASSQAKLRSHSAPKQRTESQKSGSTRQPWDHSSMNSGRGFRS